MIEASWGLGSALVSGEVTPDKYVVSKVTGEIVKRTVASKLRQHQRDPAGAGVRVAEVPAELRDVPCLADAEILALADLGRRVERTLRRSAGHRMGDRQPRRRHRAAPSALRIVLLQSRPETVWSHRRRPTPVAAPKPRAFDHVLERLRVPGTAR